MTLGSWFRDYVYIPLGGNRVSAIKWVRNIAVVWALTGFWHGAQWNFVLWGIFFGIVLAIEKLWFGKVLEKMPNALKHIYTLFLVLISFVIFNANGLLGVAEHLRSMFGFSDIPLVSFQAVYNLQSYALILVAAVIGSTSLPKRAWSFLTKHTSGMLEPVGSALILIAATAFIINGSFNPFLYFRF